MTIGTDPVLFFFTMNTGDKTVAAWWIVKVIDGEELKVTVRTVFSVLGIDIGISHVYIWRGPPARRRLERDFGCNNNSDNNILVLVLHVINRPAVTTTTAFINTKPSPRYNNIIWYIYVEVCQLLHITS